MYRFVFGGVVMVAISSLAIILLRKKYLVVFGSLCLFFTVHWVGLQSLIAAFRDHTAYFFQFLSLRKMWQAITF